MKKFLYLTFSVVPFFYGTVEAQYTSIPDINFENYLETNGMGDGVYGNGLVLTHKIDTLKVLNVPQKNISNFSGIEDFISLEFFNATLNPVSSLDLSNNTNIELLGCEYCLNLHYLDLSTLTKLKHIAVQRSGLNNLILGSKPDLRILEVFESYLTSIDLSQCPVLKELYIQDQDNYLTGLDISQNLELEILYCAINDGLTHLNTQYNPNLKLMHSSLTNISDYNL